MRLREELGEIQANDEGFQVSPGDSNANSKISRAGVPTLILMRHGSRDPGAGDRLNTEGRGQALKLTRDVQERKLARPTRIIASPRKRSQETLQYLGEDLGLKIEVETGVDERRPGETEPEFDQRVREWIQSPQLSDVENPAVWIVVSHLDWLEKAALFLSSDETDLERSAPWAPSERRIYLFQEGLWKRRN